MRFGSKFFGDRFYRIFEVVPKYLKMPSFLASDYIYLFFLVIMSGIILLVSDEMEILAHVLAIALLSLGAIAIVKFDLTHPYFWYSAFFFLYSTSYAILYSRGHYYSYRIVEFRHLGYNKEALVYCWIALVVFLLIVSPHRHAKLSGADALSVFRYKSLRAIKTSIAFVNIVVVYATLVVYSSQITKRVFNTTLVGTLIVNFGECVPILYVLLFYCMSQKKGKPAYFALLISCLPLCVLGFAIGERDLYLRVILMFVITAFSLDIIKRKHFIIIFPFGILLMALSVVFKYFFISRTTTIRLSSVQDIVYWFLDSDFTSAGVNMQILTSHPEYRAAFQGRGFVHVFTRLFFIPENYVNHGTWFTETFAPGSAFGYGFTIVGFGYVELGVFGVILIMAILALIIRFLYRKMWSNIYMYLLYIFSIPLYIYVIRSSLKVLLISLIVHAIPIVIISFLFNRLAALKMFESED